MTAIEKVIVRATGATAVSEEQRIQSLWDGYGEVLKFELVGSDIPSVVVKSVCLPVANKSRRAPAQLSYERKLRSYEVELFFYRMHAARAAAQVRLPKLYHGEKTADGFLFVLEDLDAAGFADRRRDLSAGELRACLTWLAGFHAAFVGVSPEGLWKAGTYWQLGTRAYELSKMNNEALKLAAPKLAAKLNQCRFKTLVHGDAKPANFCFSAPWNGEVAALDFQYTGAGTGMKDVAYLLDCCLPETAPLADTSEFLDVYFDALQTALRRTNTAIDAVALEAEWRGLYPLAWADFARFLDGWAPGRYPPGGFSRALIQSAMAAV